MSYQSGVSFLTLGRYLQQLVNAQATRNRELESQLAASKTNLNGNGDAPSDGNSPPSSSSTSDHKSEQKDDSSSKEVDPAGSKSNGAAGETSKDRTLTNNSSSNGNGHSQFDVNVGMGPNGEFNIGDMNMNMGMNLGMIHNMGMGMNGMNLNVLMGMDMFGARGIGHFDDPMEGDEEELEEQDGDDQSPDLDQENDAEGSLNGHSSASPNEMDNANKSRQHARRRSDAIPNGNGTSFGDEEERGRRRVRPGLKEIRVKTEEPREDEGMEE